MRTSLPTRSLRSRPSSAFTLRLARRHVHESRELGVTDRPTREDHRGVARSDTGVHTGVRTSSACCCGLRRCSAFHTFTAPAPAKYSGTHTGAVIILRAVSIGPSLSSAIMDQPLGCCRAWRGARSIVPGSLVLARGSSGRRTADGSRPLRSRQIVGGGLGAANL